MAGIVHLLNIEQDGSILFAVEAEVNTDNMQVQQWCNKLMKQKCFVFTAELFMATARLNLAETDLMK